MSLRWQPKRNQESPRNRTTGHVSDVLKRIWFKEQPTWARSGSSWTSWLHTGRGSPSLLVPARLAWNSPPRPSLDQATALLFQCTCNCAEITWAGSASSAQGQLHKGRNESFCSLRVPQPGHLDQLPHTHTSLPSPPVGC